MDIKYGISLCKQFQAASSTSLKFILKNGWKSIAYNSRLLQGIIDIQRTRYRMQLRADRKIRLCPHIIINISYISLFCLHKT